VETVWNSARVQCPGWRRCVGRGLLAETLVRTVGTTTGPASGFSGLIVLYFRMDLILYVEKMADSSFFFCFFSSTEV
jgi:hypothetical protein